MPTHQVPAMLLLFFTHSLLDYLRAESRMGKYCLKKQHFDKCSIGCCCLWKEYFLHFLFFFGSWSDGLGILGTPIVIRINCYLFSTSANTTTTTTTTTTYCPHPRNQLLLGLPFSLPLHNTMSIPYMGIDSSLYGCKGSM